MKFKPGLFLLVMMALFIPSLKAQDSTLFKPDSVVIQNKMRDLKKLNSAEFNKGSIFSILELLSGRIPGFEINRMNGNSPNPELQVQLRGPSTLFLPMNPAYCIDGILLENSDIVIPINIQSIEVLKNLSETSKFGIRGANGVIVINTQKEKLPVFELNFLTYGYIESLSRAPDYLNGPEFRKALSASIITNNVWGPANTDWLNEISQAKFSQVNFLTARGKFEHMSYQVSLNYNDRNSIIQKCENSKYGLNISMLHSAFQEKFKAEIHINSIVKKYSQIPDNPFLNAEDLFNQPAANIVSHAISFNPTIPVYLQDGSFGVNSIGLANPFAELVNSTDKRELHEFLSHLNLVYSLTRNLSLSAGYSLHKREADKNFYYSYLESAENHFREERESETRIEHNFHSEIRFNKTIRAHRIDLTISFINEFILQTELTRDSAGTSQLLSSVSRMEMNSNQSIRNLTATAFYRWKDQFLLELTLTGEKSPLYNFRNEFRYLPSVNATWSLNRKGILRELSWIDEIKLHSGYARGLRQISNFSDGYSGKIIGISPKLKGEEIGEFNLGIDLVMFLASLGFSVQYFHRITSNGILYNPSFQGLINYLKIKNTGLEFLMKYEVVTTRFISWNIDCNLSAGKNVFLSNSYTDYRKNGNPGDIYAAKYAGFASDGHLVYYNAAGDTTRDFVKQFIGNGIPKFHIGFGSRFKYKNFDCSVVCRGAFGFKIWNLTQIRSGSYYPDVNYHKNVFTLDQRIIRNSSLIESTDQVMEKGDYFKIDNLSLGYTFKFRGFVMKTARMFVAVNNVVCFTKFRGWDPEMAGIAGPEAGIYRYDAYPATKVFLMGIDLGFR